MFLEAFFSTVASKVFTEIFKRAIGKKSLNEKEIERIIEITIQKHHLSFQQQSAAFNPIGRWKLVTNKATLFFNLRDGGSGDEGYGDHRPPWEIVWKLANNQLVIDSPVYKDGWKLLVGVSTLTPQGYRAGDNQGSSFLGYVVKTA